MYYDAVDTIFTGFNYKLNTPEFFKDNRSEYDKETDFEQNFVEDIGNTCYILATGY